MQDNIDTISQSNYTITHNNRCNMGIISIWYTSARFASMPQLYANHLATSSFLLMLFHQRVLCLKYVMNEYY